MFKRMIILLMILAFVIPAIAQVKMSEITTTSTIGATAYFVVVWDSSGTDVTRIIDWEDVLAEIVEDLVLGDSVYFHSSTTTKPIFVLENTNADAFGVSLKLIKDSVSPADDDWLGMILFTGDDDGGTAFNYNSIYGVSSDVTDGDEAGWLDMAVAVDGVLKSFIRMDGSKSGVGFGEMSINEEGVDVNLRIESDTDENAFFIDGATGYVGKGDPTPDEDFDVEGDIITGETANADAHDVMNYLTTKVWCDSTVTADTDFGAILPAGYYIDTIIFKNTTVNAIGAHFCVGFSAGGEQIVADVAVTASDEGSWTILQSVDDFDAADNIFVDADDWNSASLIVWIKMSRMF